MEQGYGMILFMLLFAVISAFIWLGQNRKTSGHNGIAGFLRALVFFFACDYFLLSAVKWYLGSGEATLVESFWDIEFRSYLHYGVPLLIVSVAEPMVLRLFRGELAGKLISVFGACFPLVLFLVSFVTGRISNTIYCPVFLLCCALALLTAVCYKKEWVYYQKQEYRKALQNALPIIGAWVMMYGIYLPNELYLTNASEFSGSYGTFFAIMLIGSLLIAAGVFALELLLFPKRVFRCANLIMAGIVIMSYVQCMFLNGRLETLTGSEQEWSVTGKLINALIWIAVIGVVLFLGYHKKTVAKIWSGLCIYIALIQVVTLGYLALTTDLSANGHEGALTTENSLELSEGNNVLVFVLDRFESKWMQELIDSEGEFLEPLSDFTFYRNATSQFADTRTSIPFMLTGTEWQEGMRDAYQEYAYGNSHLLTDIKGQDFDLGIYTNASHVSESVYGLTSNYRESVSRKYRILTTYTNMWQCSMYKTTPFIIKNAYTYYSSDIAEIVDESEVWSIENDLPFYESLTKDGLSVTGSYPNAFRFYHMRGAHEPFYLSEDLKYDPTGREVSLRPQIKGSLKIIYEYLDQLKALGLYDDATIILTADHGQQVDFVESEGMPDKTLMPIMLVKEPGEHHESMVYNEAPVSHAEYIATVAKAVGLDWKDYGDTLDEASEADTSERICVSLWRGRLIKYTINGDARDLDNWKAYDIEITN